jgi:signal transduction histidine kinase
VRETLTNALKHADAQNVTVALHAESDGVIELCIADDGVGMPASARERARHYGVTGMRERAAMIGAQLHIVSTPGAGTRVTVALPT